MGGTLDGVTIGANTPSPSIIANTLGTNQYVTLSGAQQPWLNQTGAVAGTATGSVALNYLAMNDLVQADAGWGHWVRGLYVVDHVVSPATGRRISIDGFVYVDGAGTNSQGQASFVGVAGRAQGDISLGGTGMGTVTSGAYPIGEYWGGWFYGAINGGTYHDAVYGAEFDVQVAAGASVAHKIGVSIVLTDNDAVQGTVEDQGLNIARGPTVANTWKVGILFGSEQGSINSPSSTHQNWAFDSTSTLIKSSSLPGGGNTLPAHIGIDFSTVTFTDAAIKTGAAHIDMGAMASAPTGASGHGKLYVASDGSLHYLGPTTDTRLAPA